MAVTHMHGCGQDGFDGRDGCKWARVLEEIREGDDENRVLI